MTTESVDKRNENDIFEFGEFRLDPANRELLHRDEPVVLTAKVFDTLLYLVTHRGRLLSKDELMSEIWPGMFVEENNLNKNISRLRQILGERPGDYKFIKTVAGKGYKFVAAVTVVGIENPTDLALRIGESVKETLPNPGIDSKDDRDFPPPVPIRRRAAVWGAAGVIFLVFASVGIYLFSSRGSTSSQRVTKLAILPFKPLVPENRDEALELGIAETLIARLGGSGDVQVRPLGSVRKFGGVDQDAQAAGQVLAVDAVLDGSIQRSGDGVRVIVRLLDVATGTSTWNGTYDERFTNIFAVQDKIAGRVADSLKIRLNESGGTVYGRTANSEAYQLYLQGRYLSQKITLPEVRRGIEYFQQAIDADPTYALAYAGMADAYRSLPINGDIPSDDVMPKARAAAGKALEIDSQLADAHIALGYVGFWYEHNWANAEREFRTALESSPNNADAHRGLSVLLTCLGRHDEAIEEMAQARKLDPLSVITAALEGQTFLYAGRLDAAVTSLNKAFELDPNFWVAHIQMARIRIQQNDLPAALAEADKARQFSGGNSESISLAGYASARSGSPQNAIASLGILHALAEQGLTTDYNSALVYAGMGRANDALNSLEAAAGKKDVRLILLKIDPKWNGLRLEPRFAALIKELDLD
ncbi:MAG: winged helix-turn-helix domain-containing protein [Pyrinomonadaceae bacterium]